MKLSRKRPPYNRTSRMECMRMKSSWSGYCQCEVIEKLCRDAFHVLGRGSCVGQSRSAGKVYIHCSESVEEKPLSGLVRINTEDFRFLKSGVYSRLPAEPRKRPTSHLRQATDGRGGVEADRVRGDEADRRGGEDVGRVGGRGKEASVAAAALVRRPSPPATAVRLKEKRRE
uniref:Uncharacterized protein n=1 Tax=Oryza sativa subsp. japonica TaxID=39947 RepID=Q6ZLJ2_ORYSJ|nr:hypothetical protein [Oryza sativa Japonica Group]BAD30815.1 hypothetical protein [Oryza sativa Japonica Group]